MRNYQDDDWISQEELPDFFACSRATFYKVYRKHASFPKPVAYGPRRYRVGDLRRFRATIAHADAQEQSPATEPKEMAVYATAIPEVGLPVRCADVRTELLAAAREGRVLTFSEAMVPARLYPKSSAERLAMLGILNALDETFLGEHGLLLSAVVDHSGAPSSWLARASRFGRAYRRHDPLGFARQRDERFRLFELNEPVWSKRKGGELTIEKGPTSSDQRIIRNEKPTAAQIAEALRKQAEREAMRARYEVLIAA